MTTFSLAVLLHLVADWILQSDWMANHKANLRHPAGWVHGVIHVALMLLAFPPLIALSIGILHVLIDTRLPAQFWSRIYKGPSNGPYQIHVAVWMDQVFHLIILAIAVKVGA